VTRVEAEAERLRAVYAHYETDRGERRKRDGRLAGNRVIAEERAALVAQLLAGSLATPLRECRVLDVGCGDGAGLALLHSMGVPADRLEGVDLLPQRIERARARYPEFSFINADAATISAPAGAFDLVLCWTLFSSILDPEVAAAVARNVARWLRPHGCVLWYDLRYPNPANRQVRGWSARDIRRLFQGFTVELRTATVLPPLTRRLGPAAAGLYPVLRRVPPLRTHRVGLLVKGAP
jgi:ubiquinone/menaquinone biosynthesis C-methylase UbiE